MPPPDTPQNLALFGGGPATISTSRRADRLRLTFDAVIDAHEYQLDIDGAAPGPIPQGGQWVTGLLPNTSYNFRIRAGNASGWSAWSPVYLMMTRPPAPVSGPVRLSYDMAGIGFILQWSLTQTFPDEAECAVDLRRADDGGAPVDIGRGLEKGDRYIDYHYPPNVVKSYRLRFRRPRASVPGDILGGDNLSDDGPVLETRYPKPNGHLANTHSGVPSVGETGETLLLELYGYNR